MSHLRRSVIKRPRYWYSSLSHDDSWLIHGQLTDGIARSLIDKQIRVSLDGERSIDIDDEHIGGRGVVEVWTKTNNVTVFDDFLRDCCRTVTLTPARPLLCARVTASC